jgi:hypothetical protein
MKLSQSKSYKIIKLVNQYIDKYKHVQGSSEKVMSTFKIQIMAL